MPAELLFASLALAAAEPAAEPAGDLHGLLVFLSPGHGKHLHISVDGRTQLTWDFQRRKQRGIVEDLWTAVFVADHLAPQLEARGATVISLRDRDRHGTQALVDDLDPGFTTTAGWPSPTPEAHAGGMHVVAAGTATWTLRAPEPGRWQLSTRWSAHPDAAPQVDVRIDSPAGVHHARVDQTRHHDLWWPLASLDLQAGDRVTVQMSSAHPTFLADAVRLGGGTRTTTRPGAATTEHTPWFEVSAVDQLDHLGGPAWLALAPDGTPLSDMRFRARWASWAADPGDDAVFLSIHTNAGRGEGSVIYAGRDDDTEPPLPARPGSLALARSISAQLGAHLVELAPTWRHRGVRTGDLSEVSPHWNSLDGALIELGFHDSSHDAPWLLDTEFAEAAARAIVEGLLAWRSEPDP